MSETVAHGYKQALDEDLGAVYHEWTLADRLDILGADQDHKDGRALRRLREALPAAAIITVMGPFDRGDQCWSVYVTRPVHAEYEKRGATIAEVADACREALRKEAG